MRIYGKKSGRNKPGAMFARSYMYYSRQNQKSKKSSSRNNSAQNDSVADNIQIEYALKTQEEKDRDALTGICFLIFVLSGIVLFSIVEQLSGAHDLGWFFWLSVVLLFYSVHILQSKLDVIRIRRGQVQYRGVEHDDRAFSVPPSLLIEDKNAEIERIIREREPVIQRKEAAEREFAKLNKKLIKTRTIKARIDELSVEKCKLEKELSEKSYKVTWKCSERYKSFEKAMEYLRHMKVVPRNGETNTSCISGLFIPSKYVEEKNGFIKFFPTPVCMEIDEAWFCITSDSIYCFDKRNGEYRGCVGIKEYSITRTTEKWTEKEPYTTWTYRRVDGGPDRRYKDNPLVTCYNEYHRSSNDVICIRILDRKVSYQVDPLSRDYVMKHKSSFEPG